MRTYNVSLGDDIALNTTLFSDYAPLKNIIFYNINCIITGTPNGVLRLQASNDPETNTTIPLSVNPPVNWVNITDSDFIVNSAGNNMWNVRDIAYNYVRVSYTDASGGLSTATMDIILNTKGV